MKFTNDKMVGFLLTAALVLTTGELSRLAKSSDVDLTIAEDGRVRSATGVRLNFKGFRGVGSSLSI